MYHSWGSMNAWLRQIHTRNALYVPGPICDELGLADGDWVWVISHHGRIKVEVARTEAVNASTIWTWNAIGKREGAWALDRDAPEAKKGFLMNHLIHELLPPKGDGMRWSNSDPITGQAAWYDLRVRIEKAEPAALSEPHFAAVAEPGRAARAAGRTALRAGVGEMTLLPSQRVAEEARPGHRPRRLRRLPCLRGQLQGMEHRRLRRGAVRPGSLRRRRFRRLAQPRPHASRWCRRAARSSARRARRASCISRNPACIATTRPASPSARPAPPTSAPTTASCWSTRTSASAAGCAPGPAPMARARWISPPAS